MGQQHAKSCEEKPEALQMTEVHAFLLQIGLAEYVPSFIENGFSSVSAICAMDDSAMRKRCGMKAGHARLLQKKLASFAVVGCQKSAGSQEDTSRDTGQFDVTKLSMEQQLQLQRAAQQEQYSQFWMHQQLFAHASLVQKEREAATHKTPEAIKKIAREMDERFSNMLPGDWMCP